MKEVNVIWNEDMTYAWGQQIGVNQNDFKEQVIKELKDEGVDTKNYDVTITSEVCITTTKTLYSDYLYPLKSVLDNIENYWMAEIKEKR